MVSNLLIWMAAWRLLLCCWLCFYYTERPVPKKTYSWPRKPDSGNICLVFVYWHHTIGKFFRHGRSNIQSTRDLFAKFRKMPSLIVLTEAKVSAVTICFIRVTRFCKICGLHMQKSWMANVNETSDFDLTAAISGILLMVFLPIPPYLKHVVNFP